MITYCQKSMMIAGDIEAMEMYFYYAIGISQEVYSTNVVIIGRRYIRERSTLRGNKHAICNRMF